MTDHVPASADGAREVELILDGRTVKARENESLLGVARREGIDIPSLCWHPRLTAYGACRLCLVEVGQGRKSRVTTSCNYPVMDGLTVATSTEAVKTLRRGVLRLLLAMAPESMRLKGLAKRHGIDAEVLGAKADGDCILCGLCVRVCAEGVGARALVMEGRGERKGLAGPWREPAATCVSCGACAAVCPVGAKSTLPAVIRRLQHAGTGAHPCRYTRMGLFSDGECANRFECDRCEVEQRLRDRLTEHPVFLKAFGR